MSQVLCRCYCSDTSVLVYVLVILFGVASWVDINGLWVELPILVQQLPEGWDLPSYMAVIIQVANVAPLLYTITSSIWPQRRIEIPVVYVIISVGAVSCLLLAFFWKETSVIAGTEHSTALLTLQFFLALVDCTSSVAFLPFMSVFKPQYMIAYFIGEGFSGLIPSLVSLGQGAGSMECVKASHSANGTSTNFTGNSYKNMTNYFTSNKTGIFGENSLNTSLPMNGTTQISVASSTMATAVHSYPIYRPARFTVQTFFLFLMGLMILSLVSFTLLNYWSYCKREHVVNSYHSNDDESETSSWRDESDTMASMACTSADVDIPANPKSPMTWDAVDNYDSGQARVKIYNPNKRGSNWCRGKFSKSSRGVMIRKSSTNGSFSGSSAADSETDDPKRELMKKLSKTKYALFLILTAWINALVCGVLPSIQTYSCLPYGIRPYHLSVTLASISNPVACFAALFLKMTSIKSTLLMTFLGSALSGYLLLTAATSPSPPLVTHSGGGLLVILSWVVVVFFLTYTKVSIGIVFRKEGRRALLWVGAFTQVGALVGALVIFFIINYHHLFQWANPCA